MWIFLFSSIVIYNTAAFFIRKRLTIGEIYATVMFALFMNVIWDAYASFRFQAWGFFEKDKAEFTALWVILGIYPAVTVLIINWYPYSAKWWRKILYLLAWAAYSTVYEGLTIWLGVLWHSNSWNLWYSFLLYPFIYYILIIQLYGYRWLVGHFKNPL